MDKLRMQTLDGVQDNIDKITALFPNCITERKDAEGKVTLAIDFDKLRQELSSEIVEGREERYQFTWPDKKKAVLLANSPINATLRPCREESVDFDNTQNLYIEGDNLDVLKCLKETYLGKVKMIYIDPPYNTGNDFVYEDDFAESTSEYLANSGQYDEQGNRLVTNSETNGRFHTDWLNMIYPRLKVARDLMTEDGVIFISIDDNEVENLKKVCNEIFGEENFIGQISVVNNLKGRNDKKDIATCHEYILIFSKSEFAAGGMPLTEEQRRSFNLVDKNGNPYQLRDLRKRGRPDRREDRPNMYFPIYYNEETKKCSLDYHEGWVAIVPLRGDGSDGRWRWGKERVLANLSILEPYYSNISHKWGVQHRVYLNPVLAPSADFDDEYDEVQERVSKSKSFWMGGELSTDVGRRQMKELFNNACFDYPKSVALILNTMYLGSDTNSIILDFFSGSATTAHAVMQLNAEDGGNRKFIMVQLPEVTDENSEAYKAGYNTICEIGKERIRRAGKKIKEELATKQQEGGLFTKQEEKQTLDIGFRVLKLDSSNMEDIYYSPAEYNQQTLFTKAESVKSDRTSEDLLFQVMLELGATLDSKIEKTEIEDKTIYNVATNYLVACFDNEIEDSVVTAIAKMKPQYAVFRHSSMADDSTVTNFEQIFKTYSPNTVTKVL